MMKCLVCGKKFARVCTHVRQAHDMTAREYKEYYGLDVKRGLLSEEDRAVMREHTKSNGTVKNLQKGEKYRFKKGETLNYERSEQTKKRLKEHWSKVAKRTGRTPVEKIPSKCAECEVDILVYPRAFKADNNYCGVQCRNVANNRKRGLNK